MAQRDRLEKLIMEYCNEVGSRTFSLAELNNKYGNYSILDIGGNSPQNTVRRLLQELRDNGVIIFNDNRGHYTLQIPFLNGEIEEMKSIDVSSETPVKKEYLMETYVRNVKWARKAKDFHGLYCLCEKCQNTFKMSNGEPYVEVHHIIPLFEGGEDGLWNLSVLCAHHHRMAHFADHNTKHEIREYLLELNDKRFRI